MIKDYETLKHNNINI